jgi:hypothetical protein
MDWLAHRQEIWCRPFQTLFSVGLYDGKSIAAFVGSYWEIEENEEDHPGLNGSESVRGLGKHREKLGRCHDYSLICASGGAVPK